MSALRENERDPHPMELHRETMPAKDGVDIVTEEAEWLWESTTGPDEVSEVPEELLPMGLTGRNAAWLAEECKALLGVPAVWAFVPDNPMEESFRTDRLVLACPSNVYQLRQTRVIHKGESWWEWAWHGPDPPETAHGVLDMVTREWWHLYEQAMRMEHSAERVMHAEEATILWRKLKQRNDPSVKDLEPADVEPETNA